MNVLRICYEIWRETRMDVLLGGNCVPRSVSRFVSVGRLDVLHPFLTFLSTLCVCIYLRLFRCVDVNVFVFCIAQSISTCLNVLSVLVRVPLSFFFCVFYSLSAADSICFHAVYLYYCNLFAVFLLPLVYFNSGWKGMDLLEVAIAYLLEIIDHFFAAINLFFINC